MIDEAGNPVITDVGIHDFLHKHQLSTFGNSDDVRRLAPELWYGGPFTAASDVYAFGCLALGKLYSPGRGGKAHASQNF